MAIQLTRIVELTATVEAGAYADGDAFGERLDFTGALLESRNGGMLQSVVITGLITTAFVVDIVFFDDVFQPSADNDPAGFTDEDLAGKCIGHVSILAADWGAFANNATASVDNIGKAIEVKNAPGTLYAQMVARGAVTPGITSAYTVKLGFQKD